MDNKAKNVHTICITDNNSKSNLIIRLLKLHLGDISVFRRQLKKGERMEVWCENLSIYSESTLDSDNVRPTVLEKFRLWGKSDNVQLRGRMEQELDTWDTLLQSSFTKLYFVMVDMDNDRPKIIMANLVRQHDKVDVEFSNVTLIVSDERQLEKASVFILCDDWNIEKNVLNNPDCLFCKLIK